MERIKTCGHSTNIVNLIPNNKNYNYVEICAFIIPKQISLEDMYKIEVYAGKGEYRYDTINTILYFPLDAVRLFNIRETEDEIVLINDNDINHLISKFLFDYVGVIIHTYKTDFKYNMYINYLQINELLCYKYPKIISPIFNIENTKYIKSKIEGFYIVTSEKIKKMKVFGRGYSVNYTEFIISYNGNLKKVIHSWTKKRELNMLFSLNKILPNEIINIIKNYVLQNQYTEYLYYFSLTNSNIISPEIYVNCPIKRFYCVTENPLELKNY